MTRARKRGSLRLIATGGVLVVAWRVLALVFASPGSPTGREFEVVEVLLTGVGLVYVACGLTVLVKRPDRDSLLFAGFCLCAGLHWGGPLELPAGDLRTGLLFFYLLVSSLLGEALFLHFALSFPKVAQASERRVVQVLLYLPFVVGAAFAVLGVFAPGGSGLRSSAQAGFLSLHTLVSNLFPALALLLYLAYLGRSSVPAAERPLVGLMVMAMLVAWLPYLIASAAGWKTDSWNLAMVALPVAFTAAILGIKRMRDRQEVTV